ncbi:serine/threonine-protein phosphatase 1 regulatory subunit 10 [Polypterus senegalus]
MGTGPVDPRELLKALDCFLGKEGEIKSAEGVSKIFNLMKGSQKMVSRCIYLNILLQTKSQDHLNKFIRVGGYKLLNAWLTYAKSTSNAPLMQLILQTLQMLPLTVDHLKQNNTAKLVKQLSKTGENEELRKLAAMLVDGWMAIIRSQSATAAASNTHIDKKKKKEESKVKIVEKVETKMEDANKKDKPKTVRTTAPSHAKFRSTGLELETPTPVLTKKIQPPPIQLGDKYKVAPLKRQSSAPVETPPIEKKYKPLNTTPNSTKEVKVKIIPPQPMECSGFLDALNSAPVPGIKIKKKKKVVSPTTQKPCPFETKMSQDPSPVKPPSPVEVMDIDQPGTPVPAVEVPEPMDIVPDETKALPEARKEDNTMTIQKSKKKKTVHWAEELTLRQYYYFELDETERVNVNKIKDFGEAAKQEMMKDRRAFETARRLSHDAMEEKVAWSCPRPLSIPESLVVPGSGSEEKLIQQEREKGILQEIFLYKESVPDSPHEPDSEAYEPIPPKLIPLDEDSTFMDDSYMDPVDPAAPSQSPDNSTAKLPPILANLMGSMGAGRSPQQQNAGSAPPVNVQELLSTIMGAQGNQKTEDLIKQPDFSDKIKQLLGSLQNQNQSQTQGSGTANSGLLGPGPGANGNFPPTPKNGPHFSHSTQRAHYQGPHGGGSGSDGGPPGVPRMIGPPPNQQRGDGYWDQPCESMRGGPHGMRGGPYHRGRGGRGGEPNFRGRQSRGGGGNGGPPRGGGPNNQHIADMSMRPVCRHFMMKGSCRYESNCAFYHPGVNGPPL